MSDQSELLQALESVLQDADVKYELRNANVKGARTQSDGTADVYEMDVKLRLRHNEWVQEQ
jgi:hypothetical protein